MVFFSFSLLMCISTCSPAPCWTLRGSLPLAELHLCEEGSKENPVQESSFFKQVLRLWGISACVLERHREVRLEGLFKPPPSPLPLQGGCLSLSLSLHAPMGFIGGGSVVEDASVTLDVALDEDGSAHKIRRSSCLFHAVKKTTSGDSWNIVRLSVRFMLGYSSPFISSLKLYVGIQITAVAALMLPQNWFMFGCCIFYYSKKQQSRVSEWRRAVSVRTNKVVHVWRCCCCCCRGSRDTIGSFSTEFQIIVCGRY